MGKLSVFLVIAIIFVALFGATGVFADSLSNYFGSPSNCTVSFAENGFTLSFSTSNNGTINLDGTSSISGHVEFSRTGSYQYESQLINMNGSNNSVYSYETVSSGLRVSGQNLYISSSTMSGSFDFSISNDGGSGAVSHVYFKTAANGSAYVQDASITYTFTELFVDGVSVVSSVTGERFSFSIPTGYALLIQGDCDILERDYSIYNSWNFYQNDARRVNGSRERVISTGSIVDGFSFDHNLTYSQAIQWIPRNANLFGSSSNYDYSDHTPLSISSGSTFLISNPQYIGTMENVGNVQTKENTVPLTGTIYFEYTTRPTIKYIALESQIDFNQVGVYYNVFRPDVYEEIASITVDGTDVIVSPDYTGTTVPPDGGNSGQPPYNPDETVEGVLSNFINNIRSLISSATQAISDLVNSGSSFMQSIATMFTWLPDPVVSLLIAAFTILVVVGVLKVLWR